MMAYTPYVLDLLIDTSPGAYLGLQLCGITIEWPRSPP